MVKGDGPLGEGMKPALAWALALGGGLAGGLLLLLALLGVLGASTTVSTATVDAAACGSGSVGPTRPPGAAEHVLAVRDGERFGVPVPENATRGASYHLQAEGNVTLARATPDGAPDLGTSGRWAGALGGCASWSQRPDEIDAFLARGNGTVRVSVWAHG